ncbi:GNAT family N-acetyltransferase [Sporolactobacillus nakayamae]|uniref:Diamine N-acetyltransferase n=1 Tax=Sporolactobacillus nakayamae TaxID=269670 RepID=A0A1I2VMC0_9BACL|nr:GNAT family N-acetyltransferase [Sporolactobacillus nakayamae]SFG90474.1 diamine N-acetyltransferase [Sporolactobacillus nakayamae]
MSEQLYLHSPTLYELDYRQKILAQPDTMSYNKGYDLQLDNYDQKTGCIDFKKDYWAGWHSRWCGQATKRYYAYIVRKDDQMPIGDASLRYDEEQQAYCVSLVIEAKYRGYGYSEEALRLLLDLAFNQLDAEKVYDDFPNTRVPAEKAFHKVGFKRISNDIVELTKDDYCSKN